MRTKIENGVAVALRLDAELVVDIDLVCVVLGISRSAFFARAARAELKLVEDGGKLPEVGAAMKAVRRAQEALKPRKKTTP